MRRRPFFATFAFAVIDSVLQVSGLKNIYVTVALSILEVMFLTAAFGPASIFRRIRFIGKIVLGSPVEFLGESWDNFQREALILELKLRLRGPVSVGQVWLTDDGLTSWSLDLSREVTARQDRQPVPKALEEGDSLTVTFIKPFRVNPDPTDNNLPGYKLSLIGTGYVHEIIAVRSPKARRKVKVIADW